MSDRWLRPALAIVLGVTALRIFLLYFSRAELFVDETQYWLWGQNPAFGYYSKPPLLGWVLALFSATCGDSAFCIRLPGPLLHGATALVLGWLAARLWDGRTAVAVAAAYVTLPMAAIGSLQIATDSVMAPLLALALAGWCACLGPRRLTPAIFAGAMAGLAFLAKYAAIYYLGCGLLAALMLRPRPSGAQLAAMVAAFAVAVAPNVIWNAAHGFPTLAHTMDNAGWVREPSADAGLHVGRMLSFVGEQFAFFGPVAFGALLWAAATWRRRGVRVHQAVLFSLPIVALVAGQALVSHALINWAGAAYVAGTLAAVKVMSRRWRIASLAVNGAFCLALPLITVFAASFPSPERPLLERYLGRVAMSEAIIAAAREAGVETVVSDDRDVLADLFHTGRDSGVTFRATPPHGRPLHHYAFNYPYDGGAEDILLVLPGDARAPCDGAVRVGALAPETGYYRTKPLAAWRAPGDCLSPG